MAKGLKHIAAQDLVEFLSDERLRKLRTVADQGLLLHESLDDFELPEGYTKDEVWLILTAIRKQAAIFLPDDPFRDADFWFVTTSALSFDSKMLELRCATHFPLDLSLQTLQGSPYITRFLEQTLARGLEADRISVTEERIHEIFIGAPLENDIDRVISNYFVLSNEAEHLAEREITHGLIETLYYQLIEGVDANQLPRRGEVCKLDERLLPPSSKDCLDAICQRASDDFGDESRFGPVLRIINVSWFFWNFDVFACLNTLVGILLRNIMAIKWGFPVLSWLPVGYYPFGHLDTPRMEAVFNNWSKDYGFGFDFTSYFAVNVQLYLEELDRLELAIGELERLNQRIDEILSSDINNRKKAILASLVREPDALLRIAPHQRMFRVAYATARADFLELERDGYLVREQEGKAFVFRACDDLRERIVRLGEAALSLQASENTSNEMS
ncbi:hypothetical protein AALA21_01400 [Eggerthellaceae bacterium 3-80]|nr:hypothetical protein D7W09_00890 [bacterium D16-34]